MWKARHDVYYSVKALLPNIRIYTTDVCVPIPNLVECIRFAEEEISNYGLKAPMVGHVGDGNFHAAIIYDPKKKEDYKMIRDFSDKLVEKACSLENKIIKTKNVRDAVNHLRLGLSEAVFAYITDFNTYPNKIYKKNISSILHDQIEYPIIYFNSNENVKKFEEYLYTDEAKNIFINYGFKIPQD